MELISICNLSLTIQQSSMFLFLLFYCLLPSCPSPITLAITYMEIQMEFCTFSFPVGGKIATFLSQLILNYLEYQLLSCLFSAIVKSIEILCWLKKLSVLNVTSPQNFFENSIQTMNLLLFHLCTFFQSQPVHVLFH